MDKTIDVLGIGQNATDTLLIVREFPPYAGKVPFERELLSPGGQVATAIVTCARLGLRAKYIGTVGDDQRGRVQQESLSGTGVDIGSVVVRSGCPNQTAYIIIDERTGERTVLWQRAECLRLSADEIAESDIESARMLHLDGFDVDAAAWSAQFARSCGVPVSLDVDSIYPGFDAVLKNVDYLVAGSSWPAKWTGERDPFRALERIQREYGMRVAAVTLGDKGALALQDGVWTYSAAFQISCTDTTGAGDAFHGAFCYGVLADWPISATLEFANAAAALNCTAIGARGHIPSAEEVSGLQQAAQAGHVGRRFALEVAQRAKESKA